VETLVVDASVLVHVLQRSEEGRRATRQLRDRELVAPAHIDAEILHGLAGLARGGHLDEHRAAQAQRRLVSLPMARFPIAPIVEAAWGLRHNLSLYDALYLALARTIGCPLLTFDRGFATAPVRGGTITLLT
jgi:predicted nucleic acid-binding protein